MPGSVRVVAEGEHTAEQVRERVAFVLGGGRLLLLSGEGPLPAALHLRATGEEVRGPAEPLRPGLDPVPEAAAAGVTGVGWCLYRCGETCIAVGGERGAGRVGFLLSATPELVEACRAWLSRCGPWPPSDSRG